MAALDLVEFLDEGRSFSCRRGPSPATPGTNWWWLNVSGETSRYAAFRAEPGDSAKNLRPRLLAYYAQLLVDRARPREIRAAWSRPAPKPAQSPDAPTG
jgi:hypothetical protein